MESSIDIAEFRQILKLWKLQKITDAVSCKLIKLLFGDSEYLCEKNYYPVESFNDIRVALKFSNLKTFIEALRKCKVFGVIADTKEERIVGIYSPFLFENDPEKIVKEERKNRAENKNNSQHLFGNFIISRELHKELYKYLYNINKKIYNNFSSNYTAITTALKSSYSSKKKKKKCAQSCDGMQDNNGGEKEKCGASEEEVKKFFHDVNVDQTRKAELYGQLLQDYKTRNNAGNEEAREYLILLVQKYLIPYFTGHERFAKMQYIGRFVWVKNLLKMCYGKKLKDKATKDAKALMQQRITEQVKQEVHDSRANHPLGEFEWTDFDSGVRFYDDAMEGRVPIPHFAQPRPSPSAQWNVLSNRWM